jgi:Glycosyl hydrolase 108
LISCLLGFSFSTFQSFNFLTPPLPVSCIHPNFLARFQIIFPDEEAFARGHWVDENFVVAENVSGDSGGVTKYGIEVSSHPGVDIRNLTRHGAVAIYASEWQRYSIEALPETLAIAQFDVRVNGGYRNQVAPARHQRFVDRPAPAFARSWSKTVTWAPPRSSPRTVPMRSPFCVTSSSNATPVSKPSPKAPAPNSSPVGRSAIATSKNSWAFKVVAP